MSLPRPRVLSPRQPPREGPAVVDGPIVLAPALRQLSAAGDDRDALSDVVEALPAVILPALIVYGLSRNVVSDAAMRALIVGAGPDVVVAHFGDRTACLIDRFAK